MGELTLAAGLDELQEMPDLIGLNALGSLTIEWQGAAAGNRQAGGAEGAHT
jgi:hypothetical protein